MTRDERRSFDMLFRLGCLGVAVVLAAIWKIAGLPHFKAAMVVIVVVMSVVYGVVPSLLWYRSIGKKVEALAPLLYTDPDRYIEETERTLGGVRSETLQQIRLVNLGAAYCAKGAYRVGADYLEKADPDKLAPAQRGIYWADLALTQFHLDRHKRGCAILDGQAEALGPLKTDPRHGGLMAVLKCFALLNREELYLAEGELDAVQETWGDDPAIQRELDYLRRKLAARTGKRTGQ